MIRTLLLASAFALASPALAQQAQPADPAATEPTVSEPVATDVVEPAAPADAVTDDAAPAEAAPAQDSVTTTPAAPQTAAAAPATAQPNATAQVAQVVEADFPAYDTDKNGELSAAEFSAWMLKLKAASAPAGAATGENGRSAPRRKVNSAFRSG